MCLNLIPIRLLSIVDLDRFQSQMSFFGLKTLISFDIANVRKWPPLGYFSDSLKVHFLVQLNEVMIWPNVTTG